MFGYKLTDQAELDLVEIGAYIARDNEQAAQRLIERVLVKCQSIAENPRLGRARDELRPGLRSLCVGNYLIFYRLMNSAVQVVRVLHGARDLESLFNDPQYRELDSRE